jgi:anti-sigma regulatory factor (Ser/Thr protein kinase)
VFSSTDFRAMRAARADFVRLLRAHVGPEADVESAALAFGELVANAMRHAPPGEVRVTLRWAGAKPTLSVSDCGAGFTFDPMLPDTGQIGGRGLYIVNHLAGPVRVERTGGGCSVSVDLRLTLPAGGSGGLVPP